MAYTLTCVIPAYGKVELTQAAVRAALRELAPQRVVVVDNGGDYEPVAEETVLVPGENLGWLRGCNVGLEHGFADARVDAVVLLNNDVTLSRGFFTGLAEAASGRPSAGLVAPCYDDNYKSQHRYWSGPADEFPARAVEGPVHLVDGTCLLVTRGCFDRVGALDEEHFGRFGWGADVDLCARTRAAGMDVLVTQRSYLNHATAVTATSVASDYHRIALGEMSTSLTRLYGPDWRTKLGFPDHGSGPGGARGKAYFVRRRLRLLLGFKR